MRSFARRHSAHEISFGDLRRGDAPFPHCGRALLSRERGEPRADRQGEDDDQGRGVGIGLCVSLMANYQFCPSRIFAAEG